MNITLRRFYLKEIRQLAPVLIAVAAAGVLLFLLRTMIGRSHQFDGLMIDLTIFLLPCMYAFGAAANLVAQEKEQRTLNWLQSLPVQRSCVVTTKLVVSFIGFCAVCVFCTLLILPWSLQVNQATADGFGLGPGFFSFASHFGMAFYLLFAASAATWRARTLIGSIFLFLFFAAWPKIVEAVLMFVFMEPDLLKSSTSFNVIVFACSILMVYLSYRWGSIATETRATHSSRVLPNLMAVFHPLTNIHILSRDFLLTAQSALIWQTARQTGLPIVVSSLLAIAILDFIGDSRTAPQSPWREFTLLLWISLVGVMTFQPDAAHRRIRFLCDRGISGGLIWRYRILVSLIVVLTSALMISYMDLLPTISFPQSTTHLFPVFVAFLALGVAQWSGQLSFSYIVGLIQAPIVVALAIVLGGFAYYSLGAPWWLMLLLGCIPYLATRMNMQHWMEGKFNQRFWLIHAACAVCLFVLPTLAFAYHYNSQPRMSRATRSELTRELDKWKDYGLRQSFSMRIGSMVPEADIQKFSNWMFLSTASDYQRDHYKGIWTADAIGKENPMRKQHEYVAENLRQFRHLLISNSSQIIHVDEWTLRQLHTIPTMSRFHIDSHTDTENEAAWTANLRDAINVIIDLIPHVRDSGEIIQQDNADLLEIILMKHLKIPGNIQLLDEVALQKVKKILGDRAVRSEARRRAVALSWKQCNEETDWRLGYVTLGGYIIISGPRQSLAGLVDQVRQHGQVERIAERLWYMANAGSSQSDQAMQSLLSQLDIEGVNGDQDLGERSNSDPLINYPDVYSNPAILWYARWEDEAETFVKEVSKQ